MDRHHSAVREFRDWFAQLPGNHVWRLRSHDTHIICDRLEEQYSINDLKSAVIGMRHDPMIDSRNCHRLSLAIGADWIEFRIKEGRHEEKQEEKRVEQKQAKRQIESNRYDTAEKDSLLRKYIDRMRSDRAIKA